LELGQHHYRRLLAAGGHSYGEINLLGALEVAGNDGPWDQPENLEKFNGVLRLTSGTAANGFALTGMAYQADWTASEHVPERAITNGEIGRYGVLSANDGGHTHRYSLSGNWTRTTAGGAGKANLYVIDYGLNLFSAPSGFISGAQGDQHEQADQRTVWGGQASQSWLLGPAWRDTELTAGLQLRHDRIGKVGLYTTENRRRTATVREDRIEETACAATRSAPRPPPWPASSTWTTAAAPRPDRPAPSSASSSVPSNCSAKPSSTPTGAMASTATMCAARRRAPIRRTARRPKPCR